MREFPSSSPLAQLAVCNVVPWRSKHFSKWASTPVMGDKGPGFRHLIFRPGFVLVFVVSTFKLETGTSNP
jgi:hypothetical protein